MTTLQNPPPAPTSVRRLLGPPPTDPVPHPDLDSLLALLHEADLTGRGGAGFPTARKLQAVATGRRRPVVVGNAMEGEPASSKDAVLLEHAAGLVLDGLEVLGHALRAHRTVLAVGPDVVAERLELDADGRRVEVQRLRGGFVAGQETALVDQLEGGAGVPRDPLVRITTAGLDGRPTLVLNAETLAQLALLVRHGAAWFRSVGLPDDPGSSLFTLGGAVERPGVVEAARGARLADVIAGARPVGRPTAVLVGGYHGAWVPGSALATRLTRRELQPWSAAVGAGVLLVLGPGECPLAKAAKIATWLAGESARQCGPCVNGLPRMAELLADLARGRRDPALAREVERVAGLVSGRGACAHPDGTVRMVRSTLAVFGDDVHAHLGGHCLHAGAR